jgi:hypothetical protein
MIKLFWAGVLLLGMIACGHADILDHWSTNQITTNFFSLNRVVYDGTRYVAVGEESDSGGIYTSDDGLNWNLRFSDPSSWGLSLVCSQGHFVGVGGFAIDFSPNGLDWTAVVRPDSQAAEANIFAGITYGNNLYVLVSATNTGGSSWSGSILTSPDGHNWTARIPAPSVGGPIASVAYNGSTFVAVGNDDGFEYTSVNGITWVRRSIPGGSQVTSANGSFFVPLNNQTNLVSGNGTSWNLQNTGLTNELGSIIYSHGIYLAWAGNYLATSTDGLSWFQYPQPVPGNPFRQPAIATDGARLVTVESFGGGLDYNGFVYTSDALVGIRATNHSASQVAISGLVGRNYQIQSVASLSAGPNNWQTNVTLVLTNTPYVWSDNKTTNSSRFYRGVLLP